jgi:hypothetical protein
MVVCFLFVCYITLDFFYISKINFIFLKAGDGDKYYRDTQITETVTSRHTASQYRPVDFRLPVGGGQFGDISGMYSFHRIQWQYVSSYERPRAYESDFIFDSSSRQKR